ncbi:iron-sulfur cluster co-chaperone protein HscB-like isoform X2 [Macrobrachium nipponense]|uniref:iron-sulfur cluster co-chaperone protein HscB-like isoform X2 n=1 Tax=Macrobrachium nipponense TaxID=159736 RepID=UPI0030C7A372
MALLIKANMHRRAIFKLIEVLPSLTYAERSYFIQNFSTLCNGGAGNTRTVKETAIVEQLLPPFPERSSSILHPKCFCSDSQVKCWHCGKTEKQYALEHSSIINKAYHCLLNPVERALYLLDLAGQPLHEGQIDLDPEFLMEIMEVNEELAEATNKESVADIGLKNQKILDGLLMEADDAFSRNDIQTARSVVAKVKYYHNIYLKVKDYERQHGIVD